MGPLAGVRVLDLSRYLAGPVSAMLFADFGADVLRIEPPGGSDDRLVGPFAAGQSLGVQTVNRNKRSVCLNLKQARGRRLFLDLVRRSDVVVENFPPGTMERWQLGWEELAAVNPRIILVRVTGFGQSGPRSHWLAFDPIIQAMTGHMALSGQPGEAPIKSGMSMIDYGTGLYAAFGAMAALRERDRTGRGQSIDVSLYDVAISFLESALAEQHLGQPRGQMGNRRPATAPTDMFRTRDGWVYLSISTNSIWRNLLKVIGREDLLADPRFKDNWGRKQHEQELTGILADWLRDKEAVAVSEQLQAAHVACAPVLDMDGLAADPHARDRNCLVKVDVPEVGELVMPGVTPRLSLTPGAVRSRAPRPGEHTRVVLSGELGLSDAEIDQLAEEGVI